MTLSPIQAVMGALAESLPLSSRIFGGEFPKTGTHPPPSSTVQDRDSAFMTSSSIRSMMAAGRSPEEMAAALNGTPHTAGIQDIRLARKVVSVGMTELDAIRRPQDTAAVRRSLERALSGFLRSRRAMGAEDLLEIARSVGSPEMESLLRAHREKRFVLDILSKPDFEKFLQGWKNVRNVNLAFFEFKNTKSRIIIQGWDPSESESVDDATQAIAQRVLGLVHEGEHWRHFTGNSCGIEAGQAPFKLSRISRSPRYVSEIMAGLEEHRFRLRIGDFSYTRISAEERIPLAGYFRKEANEEYFAWRFWDRMANRILG